MSCPSGKLSFTAEAADAELAKIARMAHIDWRPKREKRHYLCDCGAHHLTALSSYQPNSPRPRRRQKRRGRRP